MPAPRRKAAATATAPATAPFDTTRFIHHAQVGGIDPYVIDDGEARGVRALCVNTGGGLRYRVLPDRGLDIDQAFLGPHALAFLSFKGVTRPTRALDRGLDWLKGFPCGLLTSCGPTNIGGPGSDEEGEYGLHGPHSNTAATIESVVQPDPHAGRLDMSIVGRLRYGAFYGPCVELRRTISSTLGRNVIRVRDEFVNAGNTDIPHAWLLHINLGYPLVDAGSEYCLDERKVEPLPGDPAAAKVFRPGGPFKRVPAPLGSHSGPTSYVGYVYPRPARDGSAVVALVNPRLALGVAIRYSTAEFPRVAIWQHWGRGEYVTGIEPTTGTTEGRAADRARGLLGHLAPGQRASYSYSIEAVTGREAVAELRKLNRSR